MIWFIIGLVIVLLLFTSFLSGNNYKSEDLLTGPTENEDQARFLKMDIPNFDYDSPIKCLTYINNIPQRYVKNAIYNLDIHGRINNIFYLKAFKERDSAGVIDIEKYIHKFKSFERGNFSISETDIEGYKVYDIINVAGVHLDYRKSYIVNNINEGDLVTLRPEPDNKYDQNAIQIIHVDFPFGYIPAVDCSSVKPILKKDYKVFISDIIYQGDGFIDVEIIIYEKI